MEVKLVSINARGLQDTLKRRSIFNYYRARANIICIQETHATENDEKIWEAEWGAKIVFSNGTAAARGVCILFDKTVPYRISRISNDTDGRILICELEHLDDPSKRFSLATIYAPNKDSPEFFLKVEEMLSTSSAEIMIVGDFNIVMNIKT